MSRARIVRLIDARADTIADHLIAIFATKECLWKCVEEEWSREDPVELREEPELLPSVSRFFDHVVVAAAIGYESINQQGDGHPPLPKLRVVFNDQAFVGSGKCLNNTVVSRFGVAFVREEPIVEFLSTGSN